MSPLQLFFYLLLPASAALAALGFLAYDRLVCRPRCWRHGHKPDFSAVEEETWGAYFHALPNALETLKRKGFDSPFPGSLCAWRMDRFDRRLSGALRGDLGNGFTVVDFCRCHRAVSYLARFAFPRSLHHTACITRLRRALDEDRVRPGSSAEAREVLLEHERRLGVLSGMERRFGAPLPPETAEYFYGLMLRWQAVFEEHGYVLHPDLEAWRKERHGLGI